MLVLFLRRLANNEVLYRSNAILVLFLRRLATYEVSYRSNAMGDWYIASYGTTLKGTCEYAVCATDTPVSCYGQPTVSSPTASLISLINFDLQVIEISFERVSNSV